MYEAYLEGKAQRESGWRLLRLGGENKKGGDKEAEENVRRESEREERALAGKNKEKETEENGKREIETREKEEEKQRKKVEKTSYAHETFKNWNVK